ncbi:MAG: copper homeostasis protein CutC [Terriglobales bacterium]
MDAGSEATPIPDTATETPAMRGATLEIVVTSVEDARAAAAGGATRLEVASQMEVDGLTPSLALVGQIRDAVAMPLRVMLRGNPSYAPRHEQETERMAAAAEALARMGAEGLVLGFVREGRVDIGLMCRLLAAAPYLAATFHRAFDAVSHPEEALAALKSCEQVDRVLTSGGGGSWEERLNNWRRWRILARPEMNVIAAGGLDAEAIRRLRAAAELRQFHVGRAARATPDWSAPVTEERVRALAEAARG